MLTKELVLAMMLTLIAALSGCGRIGFEPLTDESIIGNGGSSNESDDVELDTSSELIGDTTILNNIYVDTTILDPDQDSAVSFFEAGDVISNTDSATDASVEEDAADSATDTDVDSATDASADAAVDSSTDASADADVDSATDASADTDVDSSTDAEIPDTAVPDSSDGAQVNDSAAEDSGSTACGGTEVFGLCWYLAATGDSCEQHCASHGGYDTNAPEYIGTPAAGGSRDECSQILTALGQPQNVSEGTNTYGYGCHIWENSDAWWLNSPVFDPTFSGSPSRIACACIQ